ncbi:MAG: type II CAAX endopeptidase family protein [Hungatella sp.]
MNTVWRVVYPMILYEILLNVIPLIFQPPDIMIHTMLGALIAIPIYLLLYAHDRRLRGQRFDALRNIPVSGWYIGIFGVAGSVFVNNLITISQLQRLFPGVNEVNMTLYAPPFLMQLLIVGLIVPIAEELVFRGMLFFRLRDSLDFSAAAFLSALYFGVVHGNVVQGLYAFVLGLMMAWLCERCGRLRVSIQFHCAANMGSIFMTYGMEHYGLMNSAVRFCLLTLLTGLLMGVSAHKILQQTKKEV